MVPEIEAAQESIRRRAIETRVRSLQQMFKSRLDAILKHQEDAIFSQDWLDFVRQNTSDNLSVQVVSDLVFRYLSAMYQKLLAKQLMDIVDGVLDDAAAEWQQIKGAIQRMYPRAVAVDILKKCRNL